MAANSLSRCASSPETFHPVSSQSTGKLILGRECISPTFTSSKLSVSFVASKYAVPMSPDILNVTLIGFSFESPKILSSEAVTPVSVVLSVANVATAFPPTRAAAKVSASIFLYDLFFIIFLPLFILFNQSYPSAVNLCIIRILPLNERVNGFFTFLSHSFHILFLKLALWIIWLIFFHYFLLLTPSKIALISPPSRIIYIHVYNHNITRMIVVKLPYILVNPLKISK